jgi:hypothetical protein
MMKYKLTKGTNNHKMARHECHKSCNLCTSIFMLNSIEYIDNGNVIIAINGDCVLAKSVWSSTVGIANTIPNHTIEYRNSSLDILVLKLNVNAAL